MKSTATSFVAALAAIAAGLMTLKAEESSLELTAAVVPANLLACVQFVLVDDDDDTATEAVEAARQTWGRAALASGILRAGSLFVLDHDRSRKPDTYPIALSICGAVESRPKQKPLPSLSFVQLPAKAGQIAFCPSPQASPDVEACISRVRHLLQVSADQLPEFPRYGFWTKASPPQNAEEAVNGLIGAMIPVQARVALGSSIDVPINHSTDLRPLGKGIFTSCSSMPGGCPTVEGPGQPTGILIFVADP